MGKEDSMVYDRIFWNVLADLNTFKGKDCVYSDFALRNFLEY